MRVHNFLGVILKNNIIIIVQFQEPFNPSRRMLSALSVHAVREQQNNAAVNAPLNLATRDKIINHNLRAVREIAELRLPHNKRVFVALSVPVLEAEDSEFTEVRVRYREVLALLRGQHLVDWRELLGLAVVLVCQQHVPVRESPSLDVLTGQAHAVTLF